MLITLVPDLFLYIAQHLTPQEIGRLSQVCRLLSEWCRRDNLWKDILYRDYPVYRTSISSCCYIIYKRLTILHQLKEFDSIGSKSSHPLIRGLDTLIGGWCSCIPRVKFHVDYIFPSLPLIVLRTPSSSTVLPDVSVQVNGRVFTVMWHSRVGSSPPSFHPQVVPNQAYVFHSTRSHVFHSMEGLECRVALREMLHNLRDTGYIPIEYYIKTSDVDRYPDMFRMGCDDVRETAMIELTPLLREALFSPPLHNLDID